MTALTPYVADVVQVGSPGCFRMIPAGPSEQPMPCPDPIEWAGTRQVGDELWRLAACAGHRHGLDDSHPLTDDDRAYFDGVKRQWDRGLNGHRWAQPEPLVP